MIKNIDSEGCIGCSFCVRFCPGEVLALESGKAVIKHKKDCWTCFSFETYCPLRLVAVEPYRKRKPMAW